MLRRNYVASLGCLMACCLGDTVAAQTAPPTKPSTLVPSGTTAGGATRLRLVAEPAPTGISPSAAAPAASSPSTTSPATAPAPNGSAVSPPPLMPPLPTPSGTPPVPPNVPVIPPGAIPPDAGDSSYPPREPIRREPPRTNDPTVPGPDIRRLLEQGNTPAQGQPATPGLPSVRLRARVAVRDKPTIAIIEIDARMYSVRPGDEFSVNTENGPPTPMRVVKLTATEMQIELINRKLTINLY